MPGDDVLDELADGARVPHVAGHEVGVLVGWRAAADDDVRAGPPVGVGDPSAQPTGTSGDQDDATRQVAAQDRARVSSSAIARTARWPKAMAGVRHAPGPG